MRKGEATRQHIIERAAPLFNRLGYGVSMAELMAAAGLEKGGIYRHFASKEELAAAAFDHACAVATRAKFAALADLPSGMAKIEGLIHNFVALRSPIPGGCPVYNTAVEHDDGNAGLRLRAQRAFQGWLDEVAGYVRQAQDEGALRRDLDPGRLAAFLLVTLEGALIGRGLCERAALLAEVGEDLRAYVAAQRP